MKMTRQAWVLSRLAAMVLAACSATAVMAQTWPAKPVHLVVAFPPGGIVDTVARQLQPRLQSALGQPVIVENRAGAGGTLGAAEVARATPDGYKLLMTFDSYATYSLTYPKLPFQPSKDLAPVTQIARNPLILVVSPQVKAGSVKELVALSKAEPHALNYASVGAGSSNHLTAELFKAVSDAEAMHVPYKGGAPAMQDLLGGQVQMMFLSAVLAQPHVQSGKLRALAQTGAQRVPAFAGVATVEESRLPGVRGEFLGGHAGTGGNTQAGDRAIAPGDQTHRSRAGLRRPVAGAGFERHRQHARAVRIRLASRKPAVDPTGAGAPTEHGMNPTHTPGGSHVRP